MKNEKPLKKNDNDKNVESEMVHRDEMWDEWLNSRDVFEKLPEPGLRRKVIPNKSIEKINSVKKILWTILYLIIIAGIVLVIIYLLK